MAFKKKNGGVDTAPQMSTDERLKLVIDELEAIDALVGNLPTNIEAHATRARANLATLKATFVTAIRRALGSTGKTEKDRNGKPIKAPVPRTPIDEVIRSVDAINREAAKLAEMCKAAKVSMQTAQIGLEKIEKAATETTQAVKDLTAKSKRNEEAA